ncbi:MAG: Ketose-bisphosphate aldolase, class-II [Candidatus Wolfebacteria bacterium GW2011_GWA2_47_9b]|uniref:Ketose-bisphosphate aldolase, class-II n=1 Tax=Candidatus Wolfebacteria bacterium GW2011_GWA2_47_9b TaxID=1619005 RepID=A0A0G1X1M8_9BACT|nr:MAG: Ketose-bisphosphate aldolase, class-II [Candidatus Wolfebacteria bacterium GW2011_GWA2_47_9b]
MNLKEVIKKARAEKKAVGHFNISDIAALRAIVRASGKLKMPVIIGTSEGEADFIDIEVAVAMVKDMREETGQDIFLNADHFHSLEKIEEAVRAGYDSVIFDAAKLSLQENIQKTREVVDKIKGIRPDVLIEGEVGYIGESSKMLDKLPEGIAMCSVEDIQKYVSATGVDLVAPAVGNVHGMLKESDNPRLNIGLIGDIARGVDVPLVLHGGSGISDDDFRAAIAAGIAVVHINTEIRVAWREGMARGLGNHGEVAPYKIFPSAEEAVYEVVSRRLKLFGGLL